MNPRTGDFILLRLVLPLFLFGVSTLRYNGFSFVYLLMLLICPLLKMGDDPKSQRRILTYLIFLVTASALFTLSHSVLHIAMVTVNTELLPNCSRSARIWEQVGLQRFDKMIFYRVMRLVLPDPVILIVAVCILVVYRRRAALVNSTPLLGADQIQHALEVEPEEPSAARPTPEPSPERPQMRVNSARRHSSPLTGHRHHYQHLQQLPLHRQELWRAWVIESLGVFLTVLTTGAAGIMSPSVLSAVYLVIFLSVCTYWACHNKVMSIRFVYLRIFLLVYSTLHLMLYYLYQFQFFQGFFIDDNFASRLLGLYYIMKSSCEQPGEIIFAQRRVIDYVAPPVTMVLYYVLATETRRWLDRPPAANPNDLLRQGRVTNRRPTGDPERQVLTTEETAEQRESLFNSRAKDTSPCGDQSPNTNSIQLRTIRFDNNEENEAPDARLITEKDPSQPSYQTIPQRPKDLFSRRSVSGLAAALEGSLEATRTTTERPLALSLINTSIRNSYILSFMVMMAWSVTYRSWLSFILLLAACILWIVPNSRAACLYFSPLVVAYASCLILLQFVYGLNLPEELPLEKNGMKFSEIGLQRWETPTGALVVQIGFLGIFWLTLRLFMLERSMRRQQAHSEVELSSLTYNPGIPELDGSIHFGNVDNRLYSEFTAWMRDLCNKYWILVCCLSMLLVSIQQPVVIFRVVYMVMLLYFLLIFQLSYRFWRKQMLFFWWVVIIYSMGVLGCIYTYQFNQFPYLWQNKTGLSREMLKDIGLEAFESAALFQRLLTPVLFLVVIILQVHYFHKPFLKISAMNRFRNQTEHQQDLANAGTAQEFGSTRSNISKGTAQSGGAQSDFMEDINSAFHIVWAKLRNLLKRGYHTMWRFLEVHWSKVVALVLAVTVLTEVSAANFLLLVLLVCCMPFPWLYPFFCSMGFLWAGIQILFKMAYQLQVVKEAWFTNCTNQYTKNITDVVDNARWLGLEKVEKDSMFQSYITNMGALMVVTVVGHAIRYHQKQYYNTRRSRRPKDGIIFPEVTVDTIEDKLLNFVKFMFNYTFYKVGLELCLCVTVIAACLRVDVFSVLYLVMMLFFLFTPREICARLWLPYCIILGVLIPVQYAACVGLPPGLCIPYPWETKFTGPLQQWLFLPNYKNPPVAKKLMADFFQYLFVCLQYRVFCIERRVDMHDYGGGDNKPCLSNDLPRDVKKDFISSKDSYMDYLKHAVFYWSYWLSLAIVFTTGVIWITLFCLGYMILSFIYLWMGQNIMLRKRKHLIASWNFIIGYNFFVILAKCSFQLMGCVYKLKLIEHSLCWLIQLFGIQCMNPLSWNILNLPSYSVPVDDKDCSGVPSKLHWDVICCLVIIFQRKVFMTQSFSYVVLDLNVQSKFASRGAYLINQKLMQAIKMQNVKEDQSLSKVQAKLEKINHRQEELGKNVPDIQEHYLILRSGDYYLFEGDPEEDDDDIMIKADEGPPVGGLPCTTAGAGGDVPEEGEKGQEGAKDRSSMGAESSVGEADSSGGFVMMGPTEEEEEEDEENPASTPTSRMNPIQIINQAMEYGARSTVRQFRRSVSEMPPLNPTGRRMSAQAAKLEAMIREARRKSRTEMDEQHDSERPATSEGSSPMYGAPGGGPEPDLSTGPSTPRPTAISAPCEFGEGNRDLRMSDIEIVQEASGSPTTPTTVKDVEGHDTTERTEGCWSKFKASIMIIFIFLATMADTTIRFFNSLTREYRRIRRTLDQEKMAVKKRVIAQIHEADETSIQLETIVHDVLAERSCRDSETARDLDVIEQEELQKRADFKRSRSRPFLLVIAMGNLCIVYSELICYFLLILNHMCSANILSFPYPLMVFLWAMLSVPRPSKNFWISLITYTEIAISVKYIFQFKFISFNDPTQHKEPGPFWEPRIFGVEKSQHYAIFDLIQLLFIFLHRGYLKNNGLWRDHTEFTQDLERVANENNHAASSGSAVPRDERPVTSSTVFSLNPVVKFRRFYKKMTDPRFNKKVDVYVYMFLCEFLAFLIIIFGYVSFGPSTGTEDNAFEFISTNKIPVPFITMLIAQFILIIVDRALFLRKQVLGKFIFQIIHVFVIHIWLFFILPLITKNTFTKNIAPQLLYFVKCIYFGLSAYQVRSGYPKRILGNFLTTNYNYINLVLFKGYLVVPFLYELRNVMDWMWTDTSLALYHWMELEDVFTKIFVLKCWRRSEIEYPTPKGLKRYPGIKYLIGGLLLAFVFLCFWGPLTLGSVIGTTFVINPPIECSFTLSFGGFPTIFSFVSRESNLFNVSDKTKNDLSACFEDNQRALGFLKNFEKRDIINITMDGNSGNLWAITPPSYRALVKQLTSNESMRLNFQIQCRRSSMDVESSQLTVGTIFSRALGADEKSQLFHLLSKQNNQSVNLDQVFPRFMLAKKDGLQQAPSLSNPWNFVNVSASLREQQGQRWWELQERQRVGSEDNFLCPKSDEKTTRNAKSLSLLSFNERVSNNLFGKLFSSYGIIGLYATYIFVAHRLLRVLYSDISYIIKYEELPYVDRILNLCHEIYLVRENGNLILEEKLFAKLIFLYRSSDTMINWTRHKKKTIEQCSVEYPEKQHSEEGEGDVDK